jgi:hypothetical protein
MSTQPKPMNVVPKYRPGQILEVDGYWGMGRVVSVFAEVRWDSQSGDATMVGISYHMAAGGQQWTAKQSEVKRVVADE